MLNDQVRHTASPSTPAGNGDEAAVPTMVHPNLGTRDMGPVAAVMIVVVSVMLGIVVAVVVSKYL